VPNKKKQKQSEKQPKRSVPMYYQVMGTQSEISLQATTGRHCQILRNLTSDPSPSTGKKPEPPDGTWDSILPHLEKLQEREDSICRDAAIAEASLEQEREWLEEHR